MSTTEEKNELQRPGHRIQKFWCDGCSEWHTASVLAGPVVPPEQGARLKSLREVQSELDAELDDCIAQKDRRVA